MILNFKRALGNILKVKKISNVRGGFTLIEIIIAISVLSFGIIAVYEAFFAVVILTNNNASRFTASYLAQEGLEIVRNIRDNNFINNATWSSGLLTGVCVVGCQADYKIQDASSLLAYNNTFLGLNADGFYSYDFGSTPTIFKRKITVSAVLGTIDIIKVDVLITWNYNGQSLSFGIDEYLYNWD